MKKILAIILTGALAATMCAVLAGCGGNASSSSNTGTTQVFTKNSVGATSPSSTVATGSSNGEGVSATSATDENGNVVSEASENSNGSSSNSESGSSSSSSSFSNENGGGSDDWRGEQAKQYLGVDGEEGVNTSVEDSYVVNGVSYYRVRVTGSHTFDEATLFVGDNGEVLNLSTFKMLLDEQENGGNNHNDGGNGGDEYNTVAPYVGD